MIPSSFRSHLRYGTSLNFTINYANLEREFRDALILVDISRPYDDSITV